MDDYEYVDDREDVHFTMGYKEMQQISNTDLIGQLGTILGSGEMNAMKFKNQFASLSADDRLKLMCAWKYTEYKDYFDLTMDDLSRIVDLIDHNKIRHPGLKNALGLLLGTHVLQSNPSQISKPRFKEMQKLILHNESVKYILGPPDVIKYARYITAL